MKTKRQERCSKADQTEKELDSRRRQMRTEKGELKLDVRREREAESGVGFLGSWKIEYY